VSVVIGTEDPEPGQPSISLGHYRARDGSHAGAVELDVDRPHTTLVVGKRGYGKSHTLGVLAEGLARTAAVAPVVVDPMGEFSTLARSVTDPDAGAVPADVVTDPTVAPAGLDPRSWCALVDLTPGSGPGALVWQAATASDTIAGMRDHVRQTEAAEADCRAARNHLRAAGSWGVFDPDGLSPERLATPSATVLDVSGLATAPMNAVVRTVAEGLYRARIDGTVDRLPWLLVDEAHTFFDGVAADALATLLRRGRTPGVSLVAVTQRPARLPVVAVSQSDLLVAHRLTARADLDGLARARPTYLAGDLSDRVPTTPGGALVVDDRTETVQTIQIRERDTPHGGETPAASDAGGTPGDSRHT
jgi:DNA helicase HerA-like ATPase